jgi:hypothetical protein
MKPVSAIKESRETEGSVAGYERCIANSERVRWTLEEVLGDATFDLDRRFLPELLAQVEEIGCLAKQERLRLNQIRGVTYAHLFGFVEEFIVKQILKVASAYSLDELIQRRALLQFVEEEVKHQILFERTKLALQARLGACGLIGGAAEVADVIMQKSDLCVLLLANMLELVTQHHYTGVFRSTEEKEGLDPTFVRIFKSHWLEEAQHTKLDDLEIERVAKGVDAEGREAAIDELLEIGGAFDGLLKAQAELDLETLQRLIGRTLSAGEAEEVFSKQHRAYRYTFLVSALQHPRFNEAVARLTTSGSRKIAAAATALSA